MLDIAVIIPELLKYGGAERVVVECLSRWQHKHRLTAYSTDFNYAVLSEHGIGKNVTLKKLSPLLEGNAFSFLLNATFTPKLWAGEIGRHDAYNTHLWPMHLLDLDPCVWYPHEPLRMLYDLRANEDIMALTSEEERRVHVYPKYTYDTIKAGYFEPMLRAAECFDTTGRPRRVVANSKYCAKYIESVYGFSPSRIIYPGVTVADFLPPLGSEYLLTVAQLWPHKRINLIIETLRLLDDLPLYIVGNGPEKENLVNLARRLDVHDRTFFLSGLSNRELHIAFSRALAVVFAPAREPFGIVALEAMAAGKPLVAVDEGGYVEVVDDKCAFLVPPFVDVIAAKITELRNNPAVASAMGRHGRELAANYTWDAMAGQLLEEIEAAHEEWRADNALSVYERVGPLFGAQYYGWYGDGLGKEHWNDNPESGCINTMPSLGHYSSLNGIILEQHLRMAEEMGLDFFVFNLHVDKSGVAAGEYQCLRRLLDRVQAMRSPVRIAVQLCLYDYAEARCNRLFEELKEFLFRHPAYMKFAGKPLLSMFWTGVYDGDRHVLRSLRNHFHNITVLVASSLRLYDARSERNLTQRLFHGWSLFSPLELGSSDQWEAIWETVYENNDSGSMGLRCLTISPGYDDRHLDAASRKGNTYRHISRDGGKTYARMIDFALNVTKRPDLVFISTFNEFHECSYIEPSTNTGMKYLEMTKDFISQARKQWNR